MITDTALATLGRPAPVAALAWPAVTLLTGHLAPSSLVKYQQAVR